MARRQAKTVFEVIVANVGVMKAHRVLTFMIAWRMAEVELGHEPTLHEYREWWKESERTAYREQALFRQAFPGEDNPSRLMSVLADRWEQRKGVRGLGAIPAEVALA